KDTDYVYLPLLNSLGMMISAILALYMMFNNGIVARTPDRKTVFLLFRESLAFFYSRASITIYTNTNALLLGSFISFKELALYNLSFKVVAICRTPFDMLTTVVYPNVVSSKNM